jgi:ketosteroid isomerase-like protein
MRSDADLVGALTAALAAADLDAMSDLLTDDAEYVNPPYAMESGTRRGRAAVLTAVASLIDTFELAGVATEIETAANGRILMLWRGPIGMRRFGQPLPNDGAFVIDRRDDRIARVAWFREAAEARAELER